MTKAATNTRKASKKSASTQKQASSTKTKINKKLIIKYDIVTPNKIYCFYVIV